MQVYLSVVCGCAPRNHPFKATNIHLYIWKHSLQNNLKDQAVCFIDQSIKCIYKALVTSADVTKCCTETQPKTPNSKECRCRSTVARKNSLEMPEPRKKPREEPGYEGWPVLFWLCQVEIITEHGQDVHRWPAGSNNNNHSGCRGCTSRSRPQE